MFAQVILDLVASWRLRASSCRVPCPGRATGTVWRWPPVEGERVEAAAARNLLQIANEFSTRLVTTEDCLVLHPRSERRLSLRVERGLVALGQPRMYCRDTRKYGERDGLLPSLP